MQSFCLYHAAIVSRRHMEQLTRLRKRKGLSQRALAKESGVSPATVYELENARREPNPSTLRKLARALGVEVADLLEEVESPKAQAPLWSDKYRERREYDFQAAREGLERFCKHWENQLADGNLNREAFTEFGVTAEHWIPMLQVACAAEANEIIRTDKRNYHPDLYGTGSEILSLSELWPAAERYIKLGENMAAAEHEMYGDGAEVERRREMMRQLTRQIA